TLHNVGSQIGRFLKHRLAEEAVCESEARKAAILEAAVDAIITTDHKGRVIDFNPAAQRLLGRARQEAVGEEVGRVLVPSAADNGVLAGYLSPSPAVQPGERLEVSLARADGTEIPVELAVTPIRTDGPPLFTYYVRDLTER